MTEQCALQQIRRQRAGVHSDEGAIGARRIGVDRFGDQLLAGARLAGNQNIGLRRRDLRNKVQHALHPLRFADDVRESVALFQRAAQFAVLPLQPRAGNLAVDLEHQFLVVPGLREVVVGPGLESLHRYFDRAVGRDQKNGRFNVARTDVAQQVEPRTVGHHQVEQDQIVDPGLDLSQSLRGTIGQVHAVAFEVQQRLQALPDVGLVVDDQNPTPCEGRRGRLFHGHSRLIRHSQLS